MPFLFAVWAIWSMTPQLFYTASEALVCLKIAFRHRNISIPPQIFVGRLPAFPHESHPQTNGVPGQRRAAGFCRLFQNIFPSQTEAWRFPFSRNWCGKYGYKISRAWGALKHIISQRPGEIFLLIGGGPGGQRHIFLQAVCERYIYHLKKLRFPVKIGESGVDFVE